MIFIEPNKVLFSPFPLSLCRYRLYTLYSIVKKGSCAFCVQSQSTNAYTLVDSNSLTTINLNFLCVTLAALGICKSNRFTLHTFASSIILQPKPRKTFASKEFVCLCAELCVRFYFPPFSFAIFFFYIHTKNKSPAHKCIAALPTRTPSTSFYHPWQSYHCFGSLIHPRTVPLRCLSLPFFPSLLIIEA